MAKDDDILAEAKEAFEVASEAEAFNRVDAMDDLRFARLSEQWPEKVRKQREKEGRPCLTINRLPTFIRQVVNDARQNKPAITVHPADSAADPHTAEIMSGLIRQIEYQSNADVAYDVALESAVTSGFGYFRINTRYSHDDTFDQDLVIEAIPNPFSVYGDPYANRPDGSDWNSAFVVDLIPQDRFKKLYKGADEVDWFATDGYTGLQAPWVEDEQVRVAEWWKRDEVAREIMALTNGEVIAVDEYEANKLIFDLQGIQPVGQTRKVPSYKVTQYLMTGAEILQKTDWAGRYIPIVPVYGDEVNMGGVRYFRSMVRDAKDAQRMMNYWRTVTTELVALSPKAPFIGKKGTFESDLAKWETINSEAHAFVEFDGEMPQRQPFAGVPAGAMQEALSAAEDLKSITGIFDASLGAKGNETSGRAILLRQKEGDTATFHYIDNLSRAIRQAGRILIDMIPKVYSTPRILRVMGPDQQSIQVPVNQPVQVGGATPTPPAGAPGALAQPGQAASPPPAPDPGAMGQGAPPPAPDPQMAAIPMIFDLTVGKYDLTVEAGPSFSTRREEAANQMLELIRAYPNAAVVLGDLLAKNLDWPGADQVAKRLHALLPAVLQDGSDGAAPAQPPPPPSGIPPEVVSQLAEHAQQAGEQAQQSASESASLKQQLQILQLQYASLQAQRSIDQQKADTGDYKAETERMKALHEVTKPDLVGKS